MRGSDMTLARGDADSPGLVIIEFPSRAQVHACYESDTYQTLKVVRQSGASSKLVIVDGKV